LEGCTQLISLAVAIDKRVLSEDEAAARGDNPADRFKPRAKSGGNE
jgi:hypothetical protein